MRIKKNSKNKLSKNWIKHQKNEADLENKKNTIERPPAISNFIRAPKELYVSNWTPCELVEISPVDILDPEQEGIINSDNGWQDVNVKKESISTQFIFEDAANCGGINSNDQTGTQWIRFKLYEETQVSYHVEGKICSADINPEDDQTWSQWARIDDFLEITSDKQLSYACQMEFKSDSLTQTLSKGTYMVKFDVGANGDTHHLDSIIKFSLMFDPPLDVENYYEYDITSSVFKSTEENLYNINTAVISKLKGGKLKLTMPEEEAKTEKVFLKYNSPKDVPYQNYRIRQKGQFLIDTDEEIENEPEVKMIVSELPIDIKKEAKYGVEDK